jgi:RNA polymerase sigma-70 factor (ECF subfamily)
MSDKQDEEDVGRVLSGDPDAFEGIVRRWQAPIVTLAYRFCYNRERAEELAQMAFLRAFRSLSQWRGEGAFGSWLYVVATNVCRSEMRRRRLSTVPLDSAGDLIQAGAEDYGIDLPDRKRIVRYAVSTLPARYRDAITLFYFHEMNVREAARSLRVAEGTVKARLSRGRALLRKKLKRLSLE